MTADDGASVEDRLRDWVEGREDDLAEHLLGLVGIETPSDDPAAFEPFFDSLGADFEAVGLETERHLGTDTGGRLEAYTESAPTADEVQLVVGHADTVWPHGTVESNPPGHDSGTVTGPGALDMKGGLTQLVFALRALDALGLSPPLPIHVLVSSDEEVGSPESAPRIEALAKRANRVFVLEPASGPDGQIKIARKAVGRFTIRIEGKAAHAGIEPEEGASATQELGTIIHKLHGLTDVATGVTVNVGQVEAGLRPNVVAPQATAVADVRAPTTEAARAVEDEIRKLETETAGTTLTVEGEFGRPPMELTPGNRALWERVQAAGRRLGLALEGTRSGGASDGNNASQFAPTVDGFGAVGDGAHQEFEFVRLDALRQRVALLAACLVDEPLPREPEPETATPPLEETQ